MTSKGS